MNQVKDFPKLKSPFIRATNEKGDWCVTDKIEPGYEWIFEKGVRAVDKLHGTNICVNIQGGVLETIDNRTSRVITSCNIPIKGNSSKFLIGVMNACDRGWLTEDGVYYGELIGPDINKNLHKTDQYLFVPFNYLSEKYHWHSWIQNKYPKDFNSISEWFKELPSLFSERIFKEKVLAEGLVFYHPDGRMAKLRRDMFDWFKGERHKE